MGKAREQEIRVTALGLIALVMIASVLALSAAIVIGGKHQLRFPDVGGSSDVGHSSAP